MDKIIKTISESGHYRAFVLDIAETPEGFCIIEVNNINSAGVYAANVSQLVQEIDQMVF